MFKFDDMPIDLPASLDLIGIDSSPLSCGKIPARTRVLFFGLLGTLLFSLFGTQGRIRAVK